MLHRSAANMCDLCLLRGRHDLPGNSVGRGLHTLFNTSVQVSMVATDVYRPAAIDQLVSLGQRVGVPVFEMGTDARPADIARAGLQQARKVR